MLIYGIRIQNCTLLFFTKNEMLFNAEVSLNSQCIKPQEEYNCSAGECLSLGVAVWNHLTRPLHKLCLSVQFYQDYNNGVHSYKLDNRVATAGNNK